MNKNKIVPSSSETQEVKNNAFVLTSMDESQQSDTSFRWNTDSKFGSTSIKCCMISMVSGLLLLSVVILSAIWLSSFSPTVVNLSSSIRDEEFSTIVKYAQQTLKEVNVLNEAVKQQLVSEEYSYGNFDYLEKVTYSGYKASQQHLKGITISTYVGDSFGVGFGNIEWGDQLATVNSTAIGTDIYYCSNITDYEKCVRNSIPDETISPFDFSYLIQVCDENPGQQVYTLSYADPSMPQFVFITSINCVVNKKLSLPAGHNFHYYMAYDLTVTSISDFLKKKIASIVGSTGFIVETETGLLIAADRPEVSISEWKSDVLERKTPSTVSDLKINKISAALLSQFPNNNWLSITCNELKVYQQDGEFISVYRLCTKTKLDWVIVLSVPQWNYLGSTILAIIFSLIGSVLIISIGLLFGIVVSLKIVKPFYNLIELFESVANMDLDQLQVQTSSFSEVKQLQGHFISMVNRIKLYKSFIPAHLLLEIDGNQDEDTQKEGTEGGLSFRKERNNGDSSHQLSSATSESLSSSYSGSNKNANRHRHSSSIRKKGFDRNKFSLYMEQKNVTFVQIHFNGFGEWLNHMNPNDTIVLMSDIFEQISTASRTMSGNVGNFENESISISFNSSSNNQMNHEEKGAIYASALLIKLSIVKYTKWKSNELLKKHPHLLDTMSFKIAIVSQPSYCGNIGTNEIKNFTIVSSARHNLDILTRVAIQLNLSIVASEKIKEKCDQLFQMRFVDRTELVKDDDYSMNVKTLDSQAENSCSKGILGNLYELGSSMKVNEDEWMYELEEKNKQNQWQNYHQATQLYLQQDFKQAHSLLQQFYQQNPNDGPTFHLLRLCESQM